MYHKISASAESRTLAVGPKRCKLQDCGTKGFSIQIGKKEPFDLAPGAWSDDINLSDGEELVVSAPGAIGVFVLDLDASAES